MLFTPLYLYAIICWFGKIWESALTAFKIYRVVTLEVFVDASALTSFAAKTLLYSLKWKTSSGIMIPGISKLESLPSTF